VGIQREGKLAKRVMVVVSTNLFFLLGPIIVWYPISFSQDQKVWIKERSYYNLLVVSCFGINSCLNPVLYAFRNELFRSELKRLLKCGQNVIGAANNN
jgi:ABC-type spermidine/putrescine transport system permease subunit II